MGMVRVWVPGLSVGLSLCVGMGVRARAIRLDQVEIQIARLRVERPPRGGKSPDVGEDTAKASPASAFPIISASTISTPAEQLGHAARKIQIELGTAFALHGFTATKVPPRRARGNG
jgi:hypothetical protein